MNKKEFFKLALSNGKYKKLPWIITAFSLTKQPDKKGFDDYDIISDVSGYSFYNAITSSIEKIEDAKVGEPLFSFKETLIVTPSDIPNLSSTIESTYGKLLFNWIVLVNNFGKKISYQNDKINLGNIEKIILSKLEDTPKNLEDKKEDLIYVDEYLKYTDSVSFLTGLSQLCSQGLTEKLLIPPPGIKEFRDSLLEKYKDTLNEMSTVAKIEAELIEYDKKFLAGDEGENFLISKKSRNTVRKKLFLTMGAESGLDDNNVNAQLIPTSLTEGWNPAKLPEMVNNLRAGSFSRGAETELGGVAVKWLLRASSNINVTVNDCGSTLGSPIDITEENIYRLIGFTVIDKGVQKPVQTKEDAGSYLGKRILLRNPMYCKLDNTDYCKVCVGKRLVLNPTALSIAISDYGSRFMGMMMKAMHGTSLELSKMDINKALS